MQHNEIIAQPVTAADWKKRCGDTVVSFGGKSLSSNVSLFQ